MKKYSKIVLISLVFLMLFSLVGCNNAANNGGNSNSNNGGAASGSEIKDTLIWAQGTDVFSFDPNIGKETTAIQVTGNIYDTLLTVDENMNVQPMLAESWERINDLTYEFKLREDVTFHTGDKFTADDAVYSVERAINSPSVNYIVQFIDKVEKVDEYKIRITTKEPYAPILSNLTHPGVGITSKAYAEKNGEDILKTQPMGTGPYKFVEWKQGDYVKLERFDEYWGGPAATKYLTMRVIPENSQRTIALETGEIDIAYEIVPNDVSRIKDNGDLNVIEKPSLMVYYVGMNHTKPYLDNKLVREAIRLAIDPEPMIQAVLYGGAEKADTVLPPAAFGFQKDAAKIESNIEKAKKLLEEAGYPNGFETNIYVSDDQTRIEICRVIQSQLKEIGIDCKIETLEFATYVDNVGKGNHDMCLQNWTTSTGDGDYTYFALYHSSKFGSQGNRVMKEIPGMDPILEAAKASADQNERIKLYGDAEKLLTEYSVNRPLMYVNINVGLSKKVEGFKLIPNGYHKLNTVKVSK